MPQKNAREPTLEEISKELGLEQGEVVYALDAIQDPVSLFEPVYQDGGDTIFVMDPRCRTRKNLDETWIEGIAIQQAISRLSDREKSILQKRFFEGRTQMEISEEIGISQAQVSRLEKTALRHMRKNI